MTARQPLVSLLFPPAFAAEQPYLALPALTSFLRQKGVPVMQDDLAVKALDHLTSSEKLREFSCASLATAGTGLPAGMLGLDAAGAPHVADRIDRAKAVLRGQLGDFENFDEYRTAYATVEEALELVSLAHSPSRLSLSEYSMPFSPESSAQVIRAVHDQRTNVFYSFLREYVRGKLAPACPALVGVSIASLDQVIPAFTLMRFVREFLPESKIVIGGVVPSHIPEKLAGVAEFSRYFDFLVAGEGETPLWQLTETVLERRPVSGIPNLIYWNGSQFRQTEKSTVEDVRELPTPCYDGLPLDKYLSPRPVISVEPARGCHYRKCSFCNQYAVHGQTYRLRPTERLVHDLRELSRTCSTSLFNFVNEGLPAAHLLRVADAIADSGVGAQWYAGARFEPRFDHDACQRLHAGGCRKLLFGLETANQSLADSMRKGIKIEAVPAILRSCTDGGIDVHLYLMVGYPGETEDDVELTRQFVINQLPYLDRTNFTFNTSVYTPMVLSPLVKSGQGCVSKGEDYDLEYLLAVPKSVRRDGVAERRAQWLTEGIYAALPDQAAPQEITHYLVYKASSKSTCRTRPAERCAVVLPTEVSS